MLRAKSEENAPIHQQAKDQMISTTIEYIRGMPEVKAFKQQGVTREDIQQAYKKGKEINMKIEKNYVPYNCLHLLSLHTASIGIVVVSAWLALHGCNFFTNNAYDGDLFICHF